MRYFHSIRWRLMLSYLFLTLLAVSLLGILMLSLIRRQVAQQEEAYLGANARTVALQAEQLILMRPNPNLLQRLAVTAAFLSDSRVRILDAGEQVLADSGQEQIGLEATAINSAPAVAVGVVEITSGMTQGLEPGQDINTDMDLKPQVLIWEDGNVVSTAFVSNTFLVRSAPAPGMGRVFSFAVPGGPPPAGAGLVVEQRSELRSERSVRRPIGPTMAPLGYVELSEGPAFGAETLAVARRAFGLAAAVAALGALAAAALSSRRLTTPLYALMAATRRMRDGDLGARAAAYDGDEIGQLAGQFNHMAERLQASFSELAAERDALRQFIADASHELRTPITALKAFNELLRTQAGADESTREEFLAESAAQLRRLEWITRNLLDLSRMQAGLVELQLEWQPAHELLEAAGNAFQALAAERGVRLQVQPVAPDVGLTCDRMRIELALSNLLDNALKFTPAGGQIELAAEPVGERLRLSVRDSGSGVDPHDLPHIFERFYQGRDSRAGSGLGLAIVQAIVSAHAGSVAVESQPDRGSCFSIELPMAGPSAAPCL